MLSDGMRLGCYVIDRDIKRGLSEACEFVPKRAADLKPAQITLDHVAISPGVVGESHENTYELSNMCFSGC